MNRKDRNRRLSRRNVLKTGAVASALGLSGCLGGGGGDDPTPDTGDTGDSDSGTPMDSDAEDPPDRVQPYLDLLPDYYPSGYWEIIDGAMDEDPATYYTAYFGSFAEAFKTAMVDTWDFLDFNIVTLPTARVIQRFQVETSRDQWIPDVLWTYDPVAQRQMHALGITNAEYESPEKQKYNEEHYVDEYPALFGANYSFNVPTWNPTAIQDHGYTDADMPLTVDGVADAVDASPDAWNDNMAMYDGVMSTSMWQQLYQMTKIHGADETWNIMERIGQVEVDAFWSTSTMGGWVGEGDVMYGYGLAHWILVPFVLPEFSRDELTWGTRLNPTTHLGTHTISAQPQNPNRAKLFHDWSLSQQIHNEFFTNQWYFVSRRTDIDPGAVVNDPIWDVPMQVDEIRENIPSPDEIWLPYAEMTNLLSERDELRNNWYQIFS